MLCPTLCDPMNYSTADFPFLRYFLEFAQTHVHWVSDTIHPSHPLLPPTFSLSQHQGLFQLVGSLHQVAKVWSFRFSISRSSEYLGLISFKIDWFDLLAVQGTLKSLLQPHNSKASIFWLSALFVVHLSHPYMTTGKTIALTVWTFWGLNEIKSERQLAGTKPLIFELVIVAVVSFIPWKKQGCGVDPLLWYPAES